MITRNARQRAAFWTSWLFALGVALALFFSTLANADGAWITIPDWFPI